MSTDISSPDSSAETYQEGAAPVQAFSSPAIPVEAEAVLEPRRGRPVSRWIDPGHEGNLVREAQSGQGNGAADPPS